MMVIKQKRCLLFIVLAVAVLAAGLAEAKVDGIAGPEFFLTAKQGYITTGDANRINIWGFADDAGSGTVQYPGPTLIVNEGDKVTVYLTNELTVPVSLVFPGQTWVEVTGGSPGLLTWEAPPDGTTVVTYSFTAGKPGTFLYHSGTRPELQIEMGLTGAIIVRPSMGDEYAFNHADTKFDQEYLFFMTEMDPRIHELVECGKLDKIDNNDYWPVYWFLNGRNAPDDMLPAFTPLLPTQPYNCLPRINPGKKMLMRLICADRHMHPFHTHGNHVRLIGKDGRMLESTPGAGPDIGTDFYSFPVYPGGSYTGLFTWTGEGLGWDVYGTGAGYEHNCTDTDNDTFDDTTNEYCPDHGKPFPVTLPEKQSLTFGAHYSGSPFLGMLAQLPPGEGGMNMNAGYFYMWHSHNEREMVNNDIFPGGCMTMMIVEPWWVEIQK